ncbi:DUF2505 family protein [Kineosporia rhizophila]|uniref:DUF2505 family protein n=1 Tax=Kineosporia TaxID=49184 RepID=UPI000B18FEC7|nr:MULTISPECIES: DUF2505 family protein [Kineosporia]MCE0535619.1 DUF2505 family protein [Kineosporia rhizophila]GLY17736.1 hypothetical protein Kisp01_47500 [Kineosporia sp. NBRC 101677]
MSAQFGLDWVYGVSPLVTFRMMTRLEHLTEKARQLGYEDFHVLELRERAGAFRQVSERQASDIMPARRFFGGKSMMTESLIWQQSAWNGAREGEYTVELAAAPQVTIVGQLGLEPAGTVGTRFWIAVQLETHGRLGRKGGPEVAASLSARLEEEHQFRLQWLERQVPYGM